MSEDNIIFWLKDGGNLGSICFPCVDKLFMHFFLNISIRCIWQSVTMRKVWYLEEVHCCIRFHFLLCVSVFPFIEPRSRKYQTYLRKCNKQKTPVLRKSWPLYTFLWFFLWVSVFLLLSRDHGNIRCIWEIVTWRKLWWLEEADRCIRFLFFFYWAAISKVLDISEKM